MILVSKNEEVLIVALRELGVHETSGAQATQRIVEYHAATTLKATSDEVAWCSAFVNWCMQQRGIDGTKSAAARSWLTYGTSTKNAPRVGDICVFKRPPNPEHGHVAFYLQQMDGIITVLGGNQSDCVCITRESSMNLLDIRSCA